MYPGSRDIDMLQKRARLGGWGSPSAQDAMRWFAQMRTGAGAKIEQGVSQPSQQRCVDGDIEHVGSGCLQ